MSPSSSSSSSVHFKLALPFPSSSFVRFSLPLSPSLYSLLLSKLASLNLDPSTVAYSDADGDACLIRSAFDLEAACALLSDDDEAVLLLTASATPATRGRGDRDRSRSRGRADRSRSRGHDRSRSRGPLTSSSSSSDSDTPLRHKHCRRGQGKACGRVPKTHPHHRHSSPTLAKCPGAPERRQAPGWRAFGDQARRHKRRCCQPHAWGYGQRLGGGVRDEMWRPQRPSSLSDGEQTSRFGCW